MPLMTTSRRQSGIRSEQHARRRGGGEQWSDSAPESSWPVECEGPLRVCALSFCACVVPHRPNRLRRFRRSNPASAERRRLVPLFPLLVVCRVRCVCLPPYSCACPRRAATAAAARAPLVQLQLPSSAELLAGCDSIAESTAELIRLSAVAMVGWRRSSERTVEPSITRGERCCRCCGEQRDRPGASRTRTTGEAAADERSHLTTLPQRAQQRIDAGQSRGGLHRKQLRWHRIQALSLGSAPVTGRWVRRGRVRRF